jgi:hypothetical protein
VDGWMAGSRSEVFIAEDLRCAHFFLFFLELTMMWRVDDGGGSAWGMFSFSFFFFSFLVDDIRFFFPSLGVTLKTSPQVFGELGS